MNEFVGLASHQGNLYALTKDGKLFRITFNPQTGTVVSIELELPATRRD